MTEQPAVNHRPWCSAPPLRTTTDIFDRSTVRHYCPECRRQVVVIGGELQSPEADR